MKRISVWMIAVGLLAAPVMAQLSTTDAKGNAVNVGRGLMLVHESTDRYYESGGTQVVCAQGCTSFNVGDLSGPLTWEVIEKGFHNDRDNYTQLSFTVGNDGLNEAITMFRARSPLVPTMLMAPTGWTVSYANGFITWMATDPDFGIEIGTTLNTMIARYNGLLGIGFAPDTARGLADGLTSSSQDWVVSAVPAPGAFGLAALGIAGVSWVRRRFS